MKTKNPKLQDILVGIIGFILGGIAGNIFTYLLILSGFASWVVGLIPENQTFVRILGAILTAFLVVALGGAFTGVINGLAILRIDQQANKRRTLFGFGYAFGIGQGIYF